MAKRPGQAPPVLSLSSQQPFAEGTKRRCYVHPDDASLCVKVPAGGADDAKQAAEQRLELGDYAMLQRRGSPGLFERIPRFEGTVDTDLGQGIVSQLFRDTDESISRNLGELIREQGLTPGLVKAVDALKQWLREQRLLSRDTGPHNVVAVRLAKDEWKLVIIEGLVNRRFRWLTRSFRWFADYMIGRELQKFDRRVQALLDLASD